MEQLFSKILGTEGPDLVVLHGLFGMLDNWQSHGKKWAELGYRVHLIDQRNHGRSFHAREHNYDVMADDLEMYFDDHNIDQAIVLGHSMGGKTAMKFATEHEDRVQKLIIVDIAPRYYPTHHGEILAALNSVDFTQIKSRKEVDQLLEAQIDDFGTRQFLLKNLYWIDKATLAFRFNLPVLEEQIENVGEALPDYNEYLGETLFIKGANSGYISDQDRELIIQHFPNAEVTTIPDAGHWVHAEQARRFFDTVTMFLQSA